MCIEKKLWNPYIVKPPAVSMEIMPYVREQKQLYFDWSIWVMFFKDGGLLCCKF